MPECPHENIRFCPLYVESHNCRQLGCIDDAGKPCQVARGKLNYEVAVDKLRRTDPGLINEIIWARTAFEGKEQRARNMRLAGVH